MNNDERDRMIQQIAQDAAATRVHLEALRGQVDELFVRQRNTEITVAEISIRQVECPARISYSNRLNEIRNWIAFFAAAIAFIGFVISFVK